MIAHPVAGQARDLVLLTILYAMQGVPMGLAMGSLPLILQGQGISLVDQVRRERRTVLTTSPF
jgi:hypothetical protein